MTTSDSITTDDWDVVHQLAVDIFNAQTSDEALKCRSRLLAFLDDLETRYGRLPSILATRADFIDDPGTQELLLNDAHFLAESRGDMVNALHIAHSLAELYVEDLLNWTKGREWLGHMKRYLAEIDDQFYADEYGRLSKQADEREGR